ncbi:MAG: caspase family protein, partial [Bacteroidota bacterium]
DYKIKLCVESSTPLKHTQIYVNNVPQLKNASRGFNVVSSSCDYTVERTIKLQNGDNQLKVVVENQYGKTISEIRTVKYESYSGGKQNKLALIFGNSDYTSAPLRNPVNDANAIAEKLKNLGFEVIINTNGTQTEMKKAIRNFGEKLAANKGIGLFFYAGHGMQVNGENYLIPVDARIEKEQDVELEAVNLKRMLGEMDYAGNSMNIIVLDACRNNPFARSFRSSGNNGLASTNAPFGTFIAYATAPGSVAADGTGNNGLYTQEFLKALDKKGLTIENVFKEVRRNVYKISTGKQVPWDNSSIFNDFYFNK